MREIHKKLSYDGVNDSKIHSDLRCQNLKYFFFHSSLKVILIIVISPMRFTFPFLSLLFHLFLIQACDSIPRHHNFTCKWFFNFNTIRKWIIICSIGNEYRLFIGWWLFIINNGKSCEKNHENFSTFIVGGFFSHPADEANLFQLQFLIGI